MSSLGLWKGRVVAWTGDAKVGSRADKYRSLAHQCLLVAPTLSNQQFRLALIDMARVGMRLADQMDWSEAVVAQQQQVHPDQDKT